MIITSVKRWEHFVPEFENYHWLKTKVVNKIHLKLSADLLVGKLLQTPKVGSMEGHDRFGESTGWFLVI